MFSAKLFCSALAFGLAAQSALAQQPAPANTCRGNAKPPTWSYKNQTEWPAQSCRTGKQQSPVDVQMYFNVVPDLFNKVATSRLDFENYGNFDAVIENDGRTVRVSPVKMIPGFGLLSGGPLGHSIYKFSHFNFHWGSEHVFDGYRYPLELQIVHHRGNLSPEAALNEPDGYAIIAVFFRDSIIRSSNMNYLFELVQAVRKPFASVCHRFDLKSLLPDSLEKYYTYKGSLTSPNCNEAVTWILMAEPIVVSEEQLEHFSQVDVGSKFNYRQLQPINDRDIYRTVSQM